MFGWYSFMSAEPCVRILSSRLPVISLNNWVTFCGQNLLLAKKCILWLFSQNLILNDNFYPDVLSSFPVEIQYKSRRHLDKMSQNLTTGNFHCKCTLFSQTIVFAKYQAGPYFKLNWLVLSQVILDNNNRKHICVTCTNDLKTFCDCGAFSTLSNHSLPMSIYLILRWHGWMCQVSWSALRPHLLKHARLI